MIYKQRNEHSPGDVIIAPIIKRGLAFLIDWFAILLIYCSIMIIFSLLKISISSINVISIFDVDVETSGINPSFIPWLKIFLGFLPVLYFSISFYFFKGRTIGKFFLRLRVVSLYHERLGLWHCIERSLGYFASALEFGFGYIQAIWNPNRMALHDKIGETIVISHQQKPKN